MSSLLPDLPGVHSSLNFANTMKGRKKEEEEEREREGRKKGKGRETA